MCGWDWLCVFDGICGFGWFIKKFVVEWWVK